MVQDKQSQLQFSVVLFCTVNQKKKSPGVLFSHFIIKHDAQTKIFLVMYNIDKFFSENIFPGQPFFRPKIENFDFRDF